jgi:hypothetical protein
MGLMVASVDATATYLEWTEEAPFYDRERFLRAPTALSPGASATQAHREPTSPTARRLDLVAGQPEKVEDDLLLDLTEELERLPRLIPDAVHDLAGGLEAMVDGPLRIAELLDLQARTPTLPPRVSSRGRPSADIGLQPIVSNGEPAMAHLSSRIRFPMMGVANEVVISTQCETAGRQGRAEAVGINL